MATSVKQMMEAANAAVPKITPAQAKEMITKGNTLVVETTNFHKDRNWRGSRDGMKLVERFTLVGPKTLRYEFTVSDPTTWTKPWSIDSLLPKIDAPIYEFACHESNYGLINWARGTLIREAEGTAAGGNARADVYKEEEK